MKKKKKYIISRAHYCVLLRFTDTRKAFFSPGRKSYEAERNVELTRKTGNYYLKEERRKNGRTAVKKYLDLRAKKKMN